MFHELRGAVVKVAEGQVLQLALVGLEAVACHEHHGRVLPFRSSVTEYKQGRIEVRSMPPVARINLIVEFIDCVQIKSVGKRVIAS